jgi:hypothetical protein
MSREKRRLEEQAAEAIRRALPAEFLEELEAPDGGESKRRRLTEGTFGLPGYEAPDEIWYNRESLSERKMLENTPATANGNADDEEGIFGSDTLQRLKALKGKGTTATPATLSGIAGFDAYSSSDEEETEE